MTEKQQELYHQTARRLSRVGIKDPTAQIIALAEEIENYRDQIQSMVRPETPHVVYSCVHTVPFWCSTEAKDDAKRRIAAELGAALLEHGLLEIKERDDRVIHPSTLLIGRVSVIKPKEGESE